MISSSLVILALKILHEAKALKAIDEGFLDPIECVQGADIIYLSTPVLQIVPLVKKYYHI